MDKEIIFFIIFVVFSILSSLLKKKKKPELPPYADEDGAPQSPQRKKPFSFDDILREFEAETLGKPRPEEREEPAEEERRYEPEPYPQNAYQRAAEALKDQTTTYETYEGLTYADLDKNKEAEDVLEKAKEKRDKIASAQLAQSYFANELRDPEGLKKAFIMKEILDRKYF